MPWSGREILAAGTSPDKLPCGMANENTLYYGDNLDILRRYIDDESVTSPVTLEINSKRLSVKLSLGTQ
jgi:hypothetical protein